MSSGHDLTPTRLPSKLPPLDVSPPSLDFSTSSSPFSRNQPSLGGGRPSSGGTNYRGRVSPVKAHSSRPLITLTIPPSNAFNEADEDVFVSPRSAPTPPQLTAPPEYGSPASLLSPSAPGSPLRFPIPPPQECITTSSSFPEDTPLRRDRSSEFNANFSFPRKEDSTIRNTGRNTSLDLPKVRPLERKMNLRKAHSTASKSQVSLYNCPGLELLPEGRGARVPQPPPIPLPAPPSTFSTDTDDYVSGEPSITTSASSLIFVQSRSRPRTVPSPSNSPQRDEPKEDERAIVQTQPKKRGERRNAWTTDQRDQTLLRVEVNAQRLRLDELAMRFQELAEGNEKERKELTTRLADVERLVEEQQQVIEYLQSLAPLRDTGRIDWERGELSLLSSTSQIFLAHLILCLLARFRLDITAIMARTPDLESPMFSPVNTFENGSCPLRRSNTLPDGHLDRTRRQGALDSAGRRNSKDWNQFISGASLRRMDRRGAELPDSPVVREGSEATLVSSLSDVVLEITHEPRPCSTNRGVAMVANGKIAPGDERMKQWTPNMQEILAKLRTFESTSPTEG